MVFVKDEIKKHSLTIVKEIWVPGSMEKPLAVKKLLLNKEIDAVVVLGIILGPEITQNQIEERLEPYARKSITAISEMLKNNYE